MSFEFWPGWLFYAPIVPLYTILSLRNRNFLFPFYANPGLLNGGLLGESKWDFLRFLDQMDPSTLPSLFLKEIDSIESASGQIENGNLGFPLILKPDIGQRGYGVRIIRSQEALREDLQRRLGTSVIAQPLSRFQREAGIFYYRSPINQKAVLFSITDKEFPSLVADGKTALGDLILRDRRARIIAPVYFTRHRQDLDRVYPIGENIRLSECGNHCQGAIFKNGERLKSDLLLQRIDGIARKIPNFYFGRLDIRYDNEESLKQGLDFEVIEINGAASEATHIWDNETKFVAAYKTLIEQWSILFRIGREAKMLHSDIANVRVWIFLKECLRVARRRDSLSISS